MGTTTAEAHDLYQGALTLRENRARYLEKNGFGDGGYEAPWVSLKKLGPLDLGFPNTASRKRAIRLHDLHHVLARYGTDWTGEAEIGGFEIGAGCGTHWAAWVLNAGAFAYGVWIAPRAVFRGFVRGRHARSLYDGEWHESLLDENTGAMREKLGLDREPPRASLGDMVAFKLWVLGSNVYLFAPLIAIGALVWALW